MSAGALAKGSAGTGFVRHPACLEHFAGPLHPERPERLSALYDRLLACGLAEQLDVLAPAPAPVEALERVHAADYVRAVEAACAQGRALLDDGDTYVCAESFAAARLASGGVLAAVERVLRGTWKNAFVAVRPPGHHAEHDRAMGFCLFNHVAVAAAHLRAEHSIERVAIVDWDVHHGNGTQHAFERDASVFYASLHQFPHYPGTGAARERGVGAGLGATLNCPLPAGTDDRAWMAAFDATVLPALEDFDPQFVLVSAGFDAHAADPLSGTLLSTRAFAEMTKGLLDLARRRCGGRLVSVLEGGYDLDALGASAEAHVAELLQA